MALTLTLTGSAGGSGTELLAGWVGSYGGVRIVLERTGDGGMGVVMDVVTVDSLAGCARAVLLEKK